MTDERLASPPGNTGGKGTTITVDWVSAVFTSAVVGAIPGFVKETRRLFDGTVTTFHDRSAVQGYGYSCQSDVGKVIIAWGGNADTVFLKIPGDACARVESWCDLREFVSDRHGWLTRVDLAFDDFEGAHPVEEAVDRYRRGQFIAGGRPPKINCAGNWIDFDGKGRTLYVGKASNGKMLRVYEKGRQLGDATSPWVRWEAQLANVDRVIPLDTLTDPTRYMRGAYPALEFIDGDQGRIPTRKAQERISVEELAKHASNAYGGLVDFLMSQGAIAQDVVKKLRREAVPRRLSAPTAEELEERCNYLAMEAACAA